MTLGVAPWLDESLWQTVPIRYVARLGTGHTPSRSNPEYWEDCTLPWVTLADVGKFRDGKLQEITSTTEKISALGLANSSAVRHPAGTVILSRTASVGFSTILGADMATSQDFATWTCSPKLHPKFLLYALRAMAPDLQRLSMGSTHKTIYMPEIADLRIPLPSTTEQRRIVDFLDAETSRINKLLGQQTRLADLMREREQAMIDDQIDQMREAFGSLPFRRFISRIEQGASPQCENVPAGPGEWGVLKVSAVRSGYFNPSENKRLPEHQAPSRRYEIKHGDLLVTRANTPALVGSTAVAHEPPPKMLLCDKIFRIEIDPNLDKEFLTLAARSKRIRNLCSEVSHGASQSMANLKADEIKSWPIPVAPLAIQRDITRRSAISSAKIAQLHQMLESKFQTLSERRQSLITAAVTGRLDVTSARGLDVT